MISAANRSRLGAIFDILMVMALVPVAAWLGSVTGFILLGPLTTLLMVALATLLLRRNGRDWRAMGLGKLPHWKKLLLWVIGAYVAVMVVVAVVLTPTLEAAGLGAPDISVFLAIEGNFPLLIMWLVISWVVGGFAEEMLARGFLLNRFADLFGGGKSAFYLAVIAQAIIFGLAHGYQGLAGIILTGGVGAILGLVYVLTGRSLWPVIITHGLIDSISFVSLYLGVGSSG